MLIFLSDDNSRLVDALLGLDAVVAAATVAVGDDDDDDETDEAEDDCWEDVDLLLFWLLVDEGPAMGEVEALLLDT